MMKNRLLVLQVLLLEASVLLDVVKGFHRPLFNDRGRCNNQQFVGTTRTPGRRLVDLATAAVAVAASARGGGGGGQRQQQQRPAATRSSSKFRNFDEVLSTFQEEPLMVIFTSVNCGPCRLMKKEINQVNSLMGGRYKIVAVDTEKFPHVGSRFEVAALPCLLMVQNGEEILRLEGVVKAEEVIERVRTITPL